ncbi:hypothetical protein SBA4_1840027 [Candidatus Sulfopaludibacter sp. SbA4]|nr:hypothetical protein SBA4_1840027 [Candidatus Sulfopaludibacter sp. SbA4]
MFTWPISPDLLSQDVDRPVQDLTGPSLFMALQEQLGLKLEGRKLPVAIPVIDHVERVPAGN